MNSRQQPAVDIAEVASEVVRVMFEEGLNQFQATMNVMSRRKLEYGNALEIAKTAQELFEKNPTLHDHVRWQRLRKSAVPRPLNPADAFDQWQKRMEYGT